MGYLLSLVSALLYFYSFTQHSAGYTAFFALIPFFYSIIKSDSITETMLLGSLWGAALSILLSIPLYYAMITEYQFSLVFTVLLIILSVYLPFAVIYCFFSCSVKYFYNNSTGMFPLLAASLWIIIDYLMSITPFFVPWSFPGYTQINTVFIQLSDLTGIYGVSFLVIFTNTILTLIAVQSIKGYKYQFCFSLILIIASIIYGVLRIDHVENMVTDRSGRKITVSIIQGNYSAKEKWDSKNTAAIINTYVNLTKSVLEDSDIIIWPETVLNSDDKNNIGVVEGVSSLLKPGQLFITGATRKDTRNNDYNSVFVAGNTGLNYIYDKKILFPFTETSFAGFTSGNFMDSPSVFLKGSTKPVYNTQTSDIGFSICFESIYPEYIRRIKNSGAGLLVNVANDSWFGNTYEPYLHLNTNLARAVENRIYVIRSANNGISAVISPTGKIVNAIELNKRDKLTAPVTPVKITTFYSKAGDWFVLISMLIQIGLLTYQLTIRK